MCDGRPSEMAPMSLASCYSHPCINPSTSVCAGLLGGCFSMDTVQEKVIGDEVAVLAQADVTKYQCTGWLINGHISHGSGVWEVLDQSDGR